MKYVRYKARLIRAFIGLGLVVSLLVMLTGCWPFNTFPVAYFTASPLSGPAPLSVAFSAMLSEDPDGFILKWEWDFGDGSSGSGESISHTYTTAGTFTVVLRVTDDDRATATAQRTITVTAAEEPGGAGAGPTASFTATPLVGAAPLSVTFNASASAYAGHAITYYSWDFGDGVTGTGMTTTHTYAPLVTSTYNVVLRIIAADNTEGTTTKSITATVIPPTPPSAAPTASFTSAPNRQLAPLPVDFDPDNSSAAAGRWLEQYFWNFGDGSSTNQNTDAIVTHRYVTDEDEEQFTVTLVVIDNEGGTDSESRTVVIENYQPVAGFEVFDTLQAGAPAWTAPGWLTDNAIHYYDVQTGANTVWIQSNDITREDPDWTRTTADPQPVGDENAEPDTWADREFSFDPEGQDWSAGNPAGFPNPAWGIEYFRVTWGDGDSDNFDYQGPPGTGTAAENQVPHAYNFDPPGGEGSQKFTITVRVFDFLGGTDSFSRDVWLHTGPEP